MTKLCALLLLLWTSIALAEGTPAEEDEFRDVAGMLRCPTCTGISVLDSEASFSVQIKSQVREQIKAGKGRDEILQYFTARYGPWILREPPVEGVNALAWWLPLGLLTLGPIVIWLAVWRRRVELPNLGMRTTDVILAEMEQDLERARAAKGA